MNRKIIIRSIWGGVALLGALATTAVLGSRPGGVSDSSPLEPCPSTPNCYARSVRFKAPPDKVRAAAMKAVTAHGSWLTGKAITITRTDLGLDAIFLVGVFRDDLAIAIEPTDSGGAVLSFRSAARSGRSDLGLNRKRGELLLEAIRAALGE